MSKPLAIRDSVQALLGVAGFAVLATESAGQPHTSLIAITPLDGGQRLVFATYRNTRKYTNLMQNPRVSLLVDGRQTQAADGAVDGFILSAVGQVQAIAPAAQQGSLQAHLHKHPDLAAFTRDPDCALLELVVEAYQVVRGIDDANWWRVDEMTDRSTRPMD